VDDHPANSRSVDAEQHVVTPLTAGDRLRRRAVQRVALTVFINLIAESADIGEARGTPLSW
jgi:hypothetical protein